MRRIEFSSILDTKRSPNLNQTTRPNDSQQKKKKKKGESIELETLSFRLTTE